MAEAVPAAAAADDSARVDALVRAALNMYVEVLRPALRAAVQHAHQGGGSGDDMTRLATVAANVALRITRVTANPALITEEGARALMTALEYLVKELERFVQT